MCLYSIRESVTLEGDQGDRRGSPMNAQTTVQRASRTQHRATPSPGHPPRRSPERTGAPSVQDSRETPAV